MTHEKEKAQYEEDRNNHERPWELWENRQDGTNWTPCLCELAWNEWSKYRRKEPPFQPEYFSGLNWRDAEHLVGKVVEFSDNGDDWVHGGILQRISPDQSFHFRFSRAKGFVYIRTCPETHQHPTITIGDKELPRPEVEAPKYGTKYWVWKPGNILHELWDDASLDLMWLKAGRVHLAESRAQAWASWWDETVIKAIKG